MTFNFISGKSNFYLNSNQINRAIDYMPILFTEKAILRKLIGDLTVLKRNGRDISSSINVANGSLAAALSLSTDTIGKYKEHLHARGIILIDDKTWSEYRYRDGSRYKTKFIQKITFTSEFIREITNSVTNRVKMTWLFDYHPEYIEKMKAKLARNNASVLKYRLQQSVNNLLISCDNIPMSSVCQTMLNIPMSSVPNLKEKLINTLNKEESLTTILNKINQNLSKCTNTFKEWTSSAKKTALDLLISGKNPKEVCSLMVKMGYCSDYSHFVELMKINPKPDIS